MKLRDKVVMVTGASKGLGAEIAVEAARTRRRAKSRSATTLSEAKNVATSLKIKHLRSDVSSRRFSQMCRIIAHFLGTETIIM